MSKAKNEKKHNEVSFCLKNFTLDNVPFCHKTFSIKFHIPSFNHKLYPTPVDNFSVQWTKAIEFQRSINKDPLGNIIPLIADIIVFTHNVKGSGKEQIASGKVDFTNLVINDIHRYSILLSSSVLESVLRFDIDTKGAEQFIDINSSIKMEVPAALPSILVFSRKSWFVFRHNQESSESDACKLADVSLGVGSYL